MAFFVGQIVGYMYLYKVSIGIDCNSTGQGERFNTTKIEKANYKEKHIDFMVHARINKERKYKDGNKHEKTLRLKNMALISGEEFSNHFDTGKSTKGTLDDVLMLHMDDGSFKGVNTLPILSSLNATEKCNIMHVIEMIPKTRNTCLSIFNNYDSYHVQRWMRLQGESDKNLPFVRVSRQTNTDGSIEFLAPTRRFMDIHMSLLETYLKSLDKILDHLTPVVKRIAKNNTIVIMTCNFGQRMLLVNFVCSSRAKGIDLGNLLVFATDMKTLEVAQELGLTAFYDEVIFRSIPMHAAKLYGHLDFGEVMWAKVIVAHIASMLNYDFIFQDVDVVWYKNPMEYFHDSSNDMLRKYDIFFEEDGNRQLRFAPLSANSGFYYARNNDRTRYVFTSLLFSAYTLSGRSHQESLIALLTESTSLFALKVKILHVEDFSGGREYHMNPSFMKHFISKRKTPWIFHMCWTKNKDDKISYLKQMGMWHVFGKCSIDDFSDSMKDCCSSEPLISCHYRDKPSVIPCKDRPSMDGNGASFW